MKKIILVGCNGKMGSVITSRIDSDENLQIVAGVDKFKGIDRTYPVYSDISEITDHADVIIDFSNPGLLDSILDFALKNKTAVVVGTTGIDDDGIKRINSAANEVPVFFTFNMSIGINLLVELSKKAATVLGDDFDIEIIEQHHNQKIDAPSGTAFMLANAINDTLDGDMQFSYDRHSKRAKRAKKEIGIHSVRGGNIVGEHEVIFAGTDEVIKLSHSARSKEVFALGAVNAAKFICGRSPRLYSMADIIGD